MIVSDKMKVIFVVAVVWSLHLLSLVSSETADRWKRSPARGDGFDGLFGGGFTGGIGGGASIPGRKNRTNLISDTIKVGSAVSNHYPFLTPPEALSVGKESIIGSPEKIAVDRYSDICERYIKNGNISTNVNGEYMGYSLLTEPQAITDRIAVPSRLYESNPFNESHSVVIFVDDYMTNINKSSEARDALLAAYKARGDVDFIVVDTYTHFEQPYPQSAFNTERIGFFIAVGLLNLVKVVPLNKIHFIGYGLGAQTVGSVAETYSVLSLDPVERVTGLDPANPCFGEGTELQGLIRVYARFVDIIHTNSDVYGNGVAIADADFYPNGEAAIQPGCLTSSCSHKRAWEYYAESVYPGQENNFMATECESYRAFNEGLCTKYQPTPMGFAASKRALGKFFLTTKGRAPYGNSQA